MQGKQDQKRSLVRLFLGTFSQWFKPRTSQISSDLASHKAYLTSLLLLISPSRTTIKSSVMTEVSRPKLKLERCSNKTTNNITKTMVSGLMIMALQTFDCRHERRSNRPGSLCSLAYSISPTLQSHGSRRMQYTLVTPYLDATNACAFWMGTNWPVIDILTQQTRRRELHVGVEQLKTLIWMEGIGQTMAI